MDADFLSGKTTLVMGLGRFGGGVDAARFAAGCGAKVIVTDLAKREELAESVRQLEELDIQYHLGAHSQSDFEQADIVIANPAVPNDNKYLEIARSAGRTVTSAMNIFFRLCPATIIGITGANGKSTTTALTAHLLRSRLGNRVWLSGNIGNEPLLTTLDQIGPDDLVVLEISSFQIEQLAWENLAPGVALLTNLTPNHLDRYGSFERYCQAKEHIFRLQRGSKENPAVSIFNADDEIARQWCDKYNKEPRRLCLTFSADNVAGQIRATFALPGRANLANLAAALAVARHFGLSDSQIKKCLPDFRALPHRLQLVAEINGVRWYNDSKATTPASAITALDAFDCPQIIIAGGYDKHIPFDEFGKKVGQKTKAAVLIGQTADKIAQAIRADPHNHTQVETAGSLADAVSAAARLAAKGDVVLLSPACASYDMFTNFEQRGKQFIKLVNQLKR